MTREFLLPGPQTSPESAAQCDAGNPPGRPLLRPQIFVLAPGRGSLRRSWGPQQVGRSTEAGLEPCVGLDKEVGIGVAVGRQGGRAWDTRMVLAEFRAEILPKLEGLGSSCVALGKSPS